MTYRHKVAKPASSLRELRLCVRIGQSPAASSEDSTAQIPTSHLHSVCHAAPLFTSRHENQDRTASQVPRLTPATNFAPLASNPGDAGPAPFLERLTCPIL